MMSRFLLVVVFLFCYGGLCEAVLETKNVTITNEITPNTVLTVHCKSKDDDLGPHILRTGQTYWFRFRVNYWATTLFFCRFQWLSNGKYVGHWFDIFEAKNRKKRDCDTCRWNVYQDRVCRLIPEEKAEACFDYKPDMSFHRD